jgi:hypothetical protein
MAKVPGWMDKQASKFRFLKLCGTLMSGIRFISQIRLRSSLCIMMRSIGIGLPLPSALFTLPV